jgi:hypothetical protein
MKPQHQPLSVRLLGWLEGCVALLWAGTLCFAHDERAIAQIESPHLLRQLTQLLLREYGVRVTLEDCAVGTDGYYESRTRQAVVCRSRTRSHLEVVAHESIHVMQDAADGKLGNGFAIPLGWVAIQLEAPVEARLKREHAVADERQMEREAWWAETQPQLVLQLMQHRCGLSTQQFHHSSVPLLRQLRLQNCSLPTNRPGDFNLL